MSIVTADAAARTSSTSFLPLAFAVTGALLVVRIGVLILSPLDLGGDEAQYWSWNLSPDFGYYSKPPLIAWAISATTGLFGDAEWAVRLPSPMFHAGTALFLFFAGRALGDEKAGFFALVLYSLSPGVIFASALISTDTPLLFFWAWSLFALIKVQQTRSRGWAVMLGLGIGLALMSKYAGLYFLVGLALWTLGSAQGRKTVLQPRMALAGVIAFLVFLPNIVWNALHDWPTVGHTADNANWQGNLFNPGEALGFFLDQFGVFGPLTFAAFLALAVLSLMGRLKTIPNLSLLLSLSLPILAIGIAQAFISRAHANWAATAYVAAVLLLALSVTRLHWVRVAALISIGLHTVAMAGLYSFAVRPALADAVGLSNAFKRVRGWDEMAADIAMTARALDVDVVVAADRMITAELLYYGRSWLMPVLSWDADGVVQHHFEMTAKWTPEAGGRVLFVAREREVEEIRARFDSLTNIDSVTVSTGKNLTRTVHLFLLEGPTDKAPQRTPDGSGTR